MPCISDGLTGPGTAAGAAVATPQQTAVCSMETELLIGRLASITDTDLNCSSQPRDLTTSRAEMSTYLTSSLRLRADMASSKQQDQHGRYPGGTRPPHVRACRLLPRLKGLTMTSSCHGWTQKPHNSFRQTLILRLYWPGWTRRKWQSWRYCGAGVAAKKAGQVDCDWLLLPIKDGAFRTLVPS